MTVRRSEQDAALQELYDRVPEIPDCDGRCWISCGPVGMSDRELRRIRDAGYPVASFEQARMKAETHWCEALTSGKRCAVYGRGGIALRQRHNVPLAFRKEAVEFPCPHCGFMLTKPDKDIRMGLCSNCRRMVPVPA